MPRGLLRLLPAIALFIACGPAAPPESVEPLLDGLHAPEILTENASIEARSEFGGNRFVRGWRGWRRRGSIWTVPNGPASVIEAVFLDGRVRRLTLLLELAEATPGATVGVRVAGEELGPLPLARPFEVPLPPDLPLGRVPIELDFGSSQLMVQAAGFGHAWRPGSVRFEGGDLAQSGYSTIDFVRRLERPATLVGSFEPPAEPEADQRFALILETSDSAPTTAFEWRPSRLGRLLGSRRLRLPLPAGLVRVRLLAQGLGRAGRWRSLGLRQEPAPPPPPAEPVPSPPRLVVLYVLDALRADALGHLGGHPEVSPVIDRLAANGVTFGRYYSTTPETASSTKVLLAGRPVVTTGHAKLPAEGTETLGELFAAAGYRAAVFSANETASLYGATRGFEHPQPAPRFDVGARVNDSAERVHAAALAWLEELGDGERALVYLHTVNPHAPYEPPEPFRSRLAGDAGSGIDGSTRTLLDIKRGRRSIDERDEERIRALYRANVAYNDHQIGRLLTQLGEHYADGEILLIITSDHGEELFDHGGVLHGFTLYEEQLHIPLVLWWPGTLEPARVAAMADNQDLNATLRALVGAPPAAGAGRSLWPEIFGRAPQPPTERVRFAAAASVEGGIFMAATERTKLILAPRTGPSWGMGTGRGRSHDFEYVFDLARDPGESRNLAGTQALEVAWLRARLAAWLERAKLLEAGGSPVEVDDETRKHLEALGYLD